jgi:hypothetical protein
VAQGRVQTSELQKKKKEKKRNNQEIPAKTPRHHKHINLSSRI